MKNIKWIDRGWQPVSIGYVPNESAWNAEMKRCGLKNEPWPLAEGGQYCGICVTFDPRADDNFSPFCLIAVDLRNDHDALERISTIVHECSHACDYVFDITQQEPCTETRAYAVENIFKGIFGAYTKHVESINNEK